MKKLLTIKLAVNVANSIGLNLLYCSFGSFLIASLATLTNKPHSSRNATIFIISFISSFEIIIAAMPDPKVFLTTSATDVASVNPKGTKKTLANAVSTFFINDKSVLISGTSKFTNPRFWAIIFLVVIFSKIRLFFKDQIIL